jgi:hypothetical protein
VENHQGRRVRNLARADVMRNLRILGISFLAVAALMLTLDGGWPGPFAVFAALGVLSLMLPGLLQELHESMIGLPPGEKPHDVEDRESNQ